MKNLACFGNFMGTGLWSMTRWGAITASHTYLLQDFWEPGLGGAGSQMSMGEVYKGLVPAELPTFSPHGVNGMTRVPHALSSPALPLPPPRNLPFPLLGPC